MFEKGKVATIRIPPMTISGVPVIQPSELLPRAVRYLLTKQLEGRWCCIPSNRAAAATLRDADCEVWLEGDRADASATKLKQSGCGKGPEGPAV